MTIGDQVRRIEPSDQVVLDSDGNVVGFKSGKSSGLEGRMLLPDTADAVQSLVSGDGISVHPNLWCDISAANHCASDSLALDASGNANHGTRGDELSIAEMHATAGFLATNTAAIAGDDPTIHLPSINLDYNGGERLLVVVLFKCVVPPAQDQTLIGNAASNSSNGWRIKVRTTGYCDVTLYSTTTPVGTVASGNSINILADGTLHQFAVLIDGVSQRRTFWEDGVLTRLEIAGVTSCNTLENSGLHLGTSLAAPTTVAQTYAIDYRRVTLFRWAAGDEFPADVADMTPTILRLRNQPTRVPVAGEF